ncbi:unnamed protein product [Mytilus edulis]|uniref:Uncharacterized protein n=1 Tax=Mytilus edulis TaxID=6550 RepID=A0A8S3SCG3_MYTED|nr:unnamed protein product [Mytilus edulis]
MDGHIYPPCKDLKHGKEMSSSSGKDCCISTGCSINKVTENCCYLPTNAIITNRLGLVPVAIMMYCYVWYRLGGGIFLSSADGCYHKKLLKTGNGHDHDILMLSGKGQVTDYFCNLLMVAIVRNCLRLVTVAIMIYYCCLVTIRLRNISVIC